MEEKPWLIDLENWGDAACVWYVAGKDAMAGAGRQIVPIPEAERSNLVYDYLSQCGVVFITSQSREDFPFYPVPQLAIFAVDGNGGCFAMAGGIGDLAEDCYPVVYVEDGTCYRLTPNLHEFLRLVCFWPDWWIAFNAFRQHMPAAVAENESATYRLEAGRQAAQLLGLTENPDSIQLLIECLTKGSDVTLYPSKKAAAVEYRFFEL